MEKKLKHFGVLSDIPTVQPHRQEAIRAYSESEVRIPYSQLIYNQRLTWYGKLWNKIKKVGFQLKHIVLHDVLKQKIKPDAKRSTIEHRLLVDRTVRKPEQAPAPLRVDSRWSIDSSTHRALEQLRIDAREVVHEKTPLQDAEYRARREQLKAQIQHAHNPKKKHHHNRKKRK